ncbi:two-component system response regulator [Burkholderia lata]|uniref:Two-component system response regulator n=1 Tax=Burkholderia lata (strain ATCC 17760 / DSM 23089 / LMG 22485 / NCIMB 9086 / R18194 / 383) TaxID=482957 RepID=A0A6P2YL64_BURL3|nr:response regulator transcription factor [Burkholderia lata]VWD21278.1 two-component system response regulator [Burkholderia lata]
MRILLIEDELELASAIGSALDKRNIAVDCVPSLSEARFAIRECQYKVVLLDRSLPDGDGLSVIPDLRAAAPGIPVIVLTAADAITARVEGLDAGADDYLAKPFSMDELVARIRALARRSPNLQSQTVAIGALEIDPVSLAATVHGEPLDLPRRELLALQALVERAGKTVRRDQLVARVYGLNEDIQSNALDAHISRLRSKLALRDAGVEIRPIRGIGYLLSTME